MSLLYFLLFSTLALITILCLSIYYYQQWTKTSVKNMDEKQRALKMNTPPLGGGGSDTGFYVVAILGFLIFFVLFGVAIYFGTKAQSQRYSLASEAVKKGNTKLAAVALAPEIGMGIRSAEEGFGDMVWGRRY